MKFQFLKNKSVLITGHTGFKGSWLALLCNTLGAEVIGISKDNSNNKIFHDSIKNLNKKNYYFDIRNYQRLFKIINKYKPNFIFHLAAQSLVQTSYSNPLETFHNNFNSSLNLLEVCRVLNLNTSFVFITSDKSYKNVEKKSGYKENETLGGDDPYSGSKASLEMLINSYTKSFFLNKNSKTKIAVARAGNVIGGGDLSKNRIIPDAYKSWFKKKKLLLRSPLSTRPWQFVLEPLVGYVLLAEKLSKRQLVGECYNFGPSHTKHINTETLIKKLNKFSSELVPEGCFYILENDKKFKFKESMLLQLNSKKAMHDLNWKCKLNINQSLKYTADWYIKFYNKQDILDITLIQIREFLNDY